MDSSNARMTTTEASNRLFHTRVKVRDFLSNDARENEKDKMRTINFSNDLNSE
jgi:hypothetical protein